MEKKGIIALALSAGRVPENAGQRIREAADGREVVITTDKEQMEKIIDRVEIAAGDFPVSLAGAAGSLRWFHQWYAGADWLQKHPEAKELSFIITTSSGIHGRQMTEHLFGLLIAWHRRFPEVFAARERREWLKLSHGDVGLLTGRTMLILGYGAIGEQVARVAQAFDMRVIGLRRTPGKGHPPAGADRVVGYDRLPDVLPEADIVVDILPYTPDTRGFVGREEFAAMKRTALFANIGRGKTVDEDALAAAVRDGVIAGAVLDVTTVEPLPPSSPLWDLPRIIITPHYSGFHPRYDELALEKFLENLRRYTRGEPLLNVVDKGLGY